MHFFFSALQSCTLVKIIVLTEVYFSLTYKNKYFSNCIKAVALSANAELNSITFSLHFMVFNKFQSCWNWAYRFSVMFYIYTWYYLIVFFSSVYIVVCICLWMYIIHFTSYPENIIWVHILHIHLTIKIQDSRPAESQFFSQRNLRSGRLTYCMGVYLAFI